MSDSKFSETKYYNKTISDRACVYRGKLLLGDGGNGMNTSTAFSPVKKKILNSSSKRFKKANGKSINADLQQKINEIHQKLN